MYNYKTKPFQHQKQALIEGANHKNFAYFMEMGTGKTKVAIDNAAYLHQKLAIDFAFVIAPNSVYQNWQKEINVHCPIETNSYIWKVTKDKNFEYDPKKLTFVLMNVEALSHASGKKWLETKLSKVGMRSMIILDESTSIKNLKASRDIMFDRLIHWKKVDCSIPDAAFYAFFKVKGVNNSLDFAKKLILETNVGVAPGIAFGQSGEGHIRICFAAKESFINKIMDRLEPILS